MKPKLYIYHNLKFGDPINLNVIKDIREIWGKNVVLKLLKEIGPLITGLKCCTLSYGEDYVDIPVVLYERNNKWYNLETDKLWKKKVEEMGNY